MPKLESRIDIQAPQHQVWAVLTDFAAFPEWNPYQREVRGEAVEGRSLSLCVHESGGTERHYWARVVTSAAPDLLRWQVEILSAGLLRCMHTFELIASGKGKTTVEQSIRFSGPLATLVRGRFASEMGWGVEAMGKALRERVEGGSK